MLQISKILNAHMESLEWIDQSTGKLSMSVWCHLYVCVMSWDSPICIYNLAIGNKQ